MLHSGLTGTLTTRLHVAVLAFGRGQPCAKKLHSWHAVTMQGYLLQVLALTSLKRTQTAGLLVVAPVKKQFCVPAS